MSQILYLWGMFLVLPGYTPGCIMCGYQCYQKATLLLICDELSIQEALTFVHKSEHFNRPKSIIPEWIQTEIHSSDLKCTCEHRHTTGRDWEEVICVESSQEPQRWNKRPLWEQLSLPSWAAGTGENKKQKESVWFIIIIQGSPHRTFVILLQNVFSLGYFLQ